MNGYLVGNTAFLSENLPVGVLILGAMGLLLHILCVRRELRQSRGRHTAAVAALCLVLVLCGLGIWKLGSHDHTPQAVFGPGQQQTVAVVQHGQPVQWTTE